MSIRSCEKVATKYGCKNFEQKRHFCIMTSRAANDRANYNSVDVCIHSIVKVINNAGIKFEPFTVHAFRDTFATRCIEQGMLPNTLKRILGHSNLKMTMDLYAQVTPEAMRLEMEKVKIV